MPFGATWHHTLIPIPFNSMMAKGVVKDEYVADTMINTKLCKKISGTFTGTPAFNPNVTIIQNYRRSFSYLEDSVLYAWTGTGFDTIVNFNAAIGNQWLRNRLGGSGCNQRNLVTVIDTNRITINNVSLKRIITTYTNSVQGFNGTYTVSITDEIIERIMTTNKYIFPVYCEMDNTTDFYQYDGELICYEDRSFPQYRRNGFNSCDYPTTLPELKGDGNIHVFPNPAFNTVQIETPVRGTYKMELSDATGKIVRTAVLDGNKHLVELGDLKNGIYMLKISDPNGPHIIKKIVKD